MRFLILCALALLIASRIAQGGSKSPDLVPLQASHLSAMQVADGCEVSVWAENLPAARVIEVAPDDTVYLSRPDAGDVVALKDADGDGRAETRRAVITNHRNIHGLHLAGDRLLTATPSTVYASTVSADGSVSKPKAIATGFIDEPSHNMRTLAIGPDGRLYLSIGSTCNVCVEATPEIAAMLVMKADGTDRKVFASGLRNTIGFDWHPDTHALFGADHGSDNIGDDIPPEELNLLEEGKDYGWPWAWGDRQPHPHMNGPRKAEKVAASTSPALEFPAHSAPIQFKFYPRSDGLPGVSRGDAFVTFHGSWNRTRPQGYKVALVKFEGGKPVSFSDFLSGFLLDDDRQFGRPTGLGVLKDGSLLVADDNGGRIFRVSKR